VELARACDTAARSFDRRQRERYVGGERLRACPPTPRRG
jgi:hypothetical protein